MKNYEFGLAHDNGTTTIAVRAENLEAAKRMVCAAEGCPERAIVWFRVIPTAKEIAKTKNLLRGL